MKRPSPSQATRSVKRPTFTGRLPAELDDAARLCATNDRQGSLDPAEIARLVEIAAQRRIAIPRPWSAQRQCAALGASVGPPWSSAIGRWESELAAVAEPSPPTGFSIGGFQFSGFPFGAFSIGWPFQREEQRAASPAQAYEEDLPPEMQREIMARLAEADPRGALDLASASRTQRDILESIPAATLGTPLGLTARPDVRAGTGYDYARTMAAIGAGDGRASAILVEALCLMQAFARYVFSDGRTLRQRVPSHAPRHRAFGATDVPDGGDPLLFDRVGVIRPNRGGPIDPIMVRDWYLWTTIPSDGEYRQVARDSPLRADIVARIDGTGHQREEETEYIRDVISRGGADVAVLPHARQSESGHRIDRAQTIGFVDLATLENIVIGTPSIEPGYRVTREEVEEWERSGGLRMLEASPEAGAALRAYVDERIASHLRGPCARLTPETGLSLPRFSSLFDVDLYVRSQPSSGIIEIVAGIRSPEIERLLASAGAPVPRAAAPYLPWFRRERRR